MNYVNKDVKIGRQVLCRQIGCGKLDLILGMIYRPGYHSKAEEATQQ
jgi:hypothetical protein